MAGMTAKWAAAAAAFALAAGGAMAADEMVAAKRRLMAGVAQLQVARDAIAASIPISDHGSAYPDGALVVTLKAAVRGHDLEAHLLRSGGAWRECRAIAPGWNPLSYRAEAGKLTVTDGKLAGTLTVHLVPCSDLRFDDPDRGREMPVSWTLEAGIGGGAGKAKPIDPRQPMPAGPFDATAVWRPYEQPKFAAVKPPRVLDIRAEATWYVGEACRLYEDVRAMELQRTSGLPFALARGQITRYRPDYLPPTAEEAAAAKDEKPTIKPGKGGKVGRPDRTTSGKQPKGPDLGGDLGGDFGETPAAPAITPAEAKRQLAAVNAMADYAETLLKAVKEYEAAAGQEPPVQVGDAECDDDEFGPWGPCTRMKQDANQNVLPGAGAAKPLPAGASEWQYLDSWRVIGPFTLSAWPSQTPLLADVVPDFAACLLVDANAFPRQHSACAYYGNGFSRWEAITCDPRNGRVVPPCYSIRKYPAYGIEYGAFVAVADVVAPEAGERWAALQMDDTGALWVNGRLAWRSGPADYNSDLNTWRVKLSLRKGVNRVMVWCENAQADHCYAMKLCTGGSPRTKAVVAATAGMRKFAYDKLEHPLKGVMGWRGDGGGNWPAARPPVAWDLDGGANIAWRTPLGTSNGSVVIAGDKLITTEEPFDLVCLDKASGKVLWRQAVDPLEVTDPDAFRQTRALWAKHLADPNAAEVRAELNKVYYAKTGTKLDKTENYTGNAMATPVTDGRRIWWKPGSRAVACYDLDGKRLWMQPTEAVGGGMGHPIASSVLVGGKLICQVPRYQGPAYARKGAAAAAPAGAEAPPVTTEDDDAPDRHPDRRQVLRAWDAETGKPLWTSRIYAVPNHGNRYDADATASPHVMRLANGHEQLDVVVTAGGAVFRAEDGEAVLPGMDVQNSVCTSVDDGRGLLIFTNPTHAGHSGTFGYVAGVELILHDRDHVSARVRWMQGIPGSFPGGFACHGGAFWAWQKEGGLGALVTVWAADGRFEQLWGLTRHDIGDPYMPPTLAGDVLYVADDGRCSRNRFLTWHNPQVPPEQREPLLSGVMTAVRVGPRPRVLARNAMEGLTMAPAMDGERMYIRSRKSLLCVAPTGPAGDRYQALTVARTVLADLQTTPLDDAQPAAAEPLAKLPAEYVPEMLELARPMTTWSVMSPIAAARRDEAAAAAHFPTGTGWLRLKKAPSCDANVQAMARRNEAEIPSRTMVDSFEYGLALDAAKVHAGKAGSVALWTTIVRVDRRRILRADLDGPITAAWVGGQKLARGGRVLVNRGDYVVSMETALPDGAARSLPARLRFWDSDDVAAERARRRQAVQDVRAELQRAVELVPDTSAAKLAAEMLKEQ